MWSRKYKIWIHYRKDIVAADVSSAMFLSAYLRKAAFEKSYIRHLEIADLQRYKVLKDARKVKIALNERVKMPFVFVYGRN